MEAGEGGVRPDAGGRLMDFLSFARAHGLLLEHAVPDGKWHRCPTSDHPKKKNGAWKLAIDGRVGWVRDWATMGGTVMWTVDEKVAATLPPAPDWSAIRAKRAQERRERAEATRRALAFYEAAEALRGGHPYLETHGLDMTGCMGLKLDAEGWLVVPAYRGGRLISLQRISPTGEKKFWYGASMDRVRYVVERKAATITVLCEGLATGLAIYAAAPLTRIVVAFAASNMVKIAEEQGFSGMVCVAGDNDHRTTCNAHKREGATEPFQPWAERPEWCECNPGRCAAEKAALALGCGYVVPENIQGTDWCDWRQESVMNRLERPVYGREETEGNIRRAVDAKIASAVLMAAKFVVGK